LLCIAMYCIIKKLTIRFDKNTEVENE